MFFQDSIYACALLDFKILLNRCSENMNCFTIIHAITNNLWQNSIAISFANFARLFLFGCRSLWRKRLSSCSLWLQTSTEAFLQLLTCVHLLNHTFYSEGEGGWWWLYKIHSRRKYHSCKNAQTRGCCVCYFQACCDNFLPLYMRVLFICILL